MEIKRGRYVLRSDAACVWIDEEYEYTEKKTGKTKTKVRNASGYYPTFKMLAEWGLAPHSLRSSEAKSMKKLLEDVKAIEEKIANMTYEKTEKLTSKKGKNNG